MLRLNDRPARVETLRSTGGLPPEICNTFREPLGFQQTESGVYYVFDRRGHAVYSVDPEMRGVRKVVEIGGEGGRILEPTAFDLAPDGRFVVADAPNRRERLQVFDFAGNWRTGFTLPGRVEPRVNYRRSRHRRREHAGVSGAAASRSTSRRPDRSSPSTA